MMLSLIASTFVVPALGADNGLARTPPMGWSTWNAFGRHFNETTFIDAADLMASNGMQSAGYEYINVDGGWWNGSDTKHIQRNASGFPQWNPDKYPSGLPTIIDYIHSKGFKYGHYSDAGKSACNHDSPMSEGYEHQDITLFAEWGIDMIKIDSCGVQEDNKTISNRWRKELNATGRPILLSNCHIGCSSPGSMGPEFSMGWADWCSDDSNMWRSSQDIRPTWTSVMFNLHSLVGMGAHGKPGGWNDPDLLEVGNGAFNSVEAARAHFTMWSVTSSPLIASLKLKNMKPDILNILINKDAIAVNQQYAGNAGDLLERQGGKIVTTCQWGRCYDMGAGEVWYKPLPGGEAAVALLNTQNKTGTPMGLNVSFSALAALGSNVEKCTVFDIWEGNSTEVHKELVVEAVQPMSVKFFRISDCTHSEVIAV